MTAFAERLAQSSMRLGPKCTTCEALAELDATDLAAYNQALDDPRVVKAAIARALGIQPSTYLVHVRNGHVEPR